MEVREGVLRRVGHVSAHGIECKELVAGQVAVVVQFQRRRIEILRGVPLFFPDGFAFRRAPLQAEGVVGLPGVLQAEGGIEIVFVLLAVGIIDLPLVDSGFVIDAGVLPFVGGGGVGGKGIAFALVVIVGCVGLVSHLIIEAWFGKSFGN